MTYFRILICFATFFSAGIASQQSATEYQSTSQDASRASEFDIAKDQWVETILRRLSLEEKVAQMVMPKAFGFYVSQESDEWRRLVHLVKERKVGSIAVFAGDVYETAVMLNRLQGLASIPLLVGADFERGVAMRTRRSTPFPEAMAVAAAQNLLLAYEMGKIVGVEARAMGIHQNFAPVADVNSDPSNPVINTRSYGEDPEWVAKMAEAYAVGLQSGGTVATAKHFPGHGATTVDSHIGLPTLDHSRTWLDSVELFPFRKLITAGIKSVMIGHLWVPALDSTRNLPATLSGKIVTQLLKNEMGFRGLVISDAFDMQSLSRYFGLEGAAVRAVKAGVDLLMVPPAGSEDALMSAIVDAVRLGQLPEQRVDESVRKILMLKRWLQLDKKRFVDPTQIASLLGTPEHWNVARAIARSSVTLLHNDNIIPLQRLGLKKKIMNVIISDNDDYRTEIHRPAGQVTSERVGSYFETQVRRRYANTETFRLDPRTNAMEFDSLLARIKASDAILCPVFVKARSGSGKFGLPQQVIDFANVLATKGKPTVFIAMGSPYILGALKNGNAYLCAYSDGELATEAAIEGLFGEIPIRGKLPVTIPGVFPIASGIDLPQWQLRQESPVVVGFDEQKLSLLDTIMTKSVRDSAFPGGQLLVAKEGAIVYNKSFGRLNYSSTTAFVNMATMYDLASLTKVIASTAAVMKLYDEGKLTLDDTVARFIPEFANRGKENITIRNLLLHNDGLPAFQRLHFTNSGQEALDSIYNATLVSSPGDSMVYSDFGFIVLGKVIEMITGTSLDTFVTRTFFQPLAMQRTLFNPPENLWDNVASTELDTVWRKKLVQGTVHDENAALMGGVAGHAGLFSISSDLAIFMQMIMNGGSYAGKQFLKPETIQLFTAPQDEKPTRALGWDIKTVNGYSSAGSLFSRKTFGHTGFTGTSVWADPERNIFVILLTNRICPSRNNTKIYAIRPVVHDTVVRALKSRMDLEKWSDRFEKE